MKKMKKDKNGLSNDFDLNCLTLLNKQNEATMEIKRLRNLAIEVFKTIKNLNRKNMRKILHKSTLLMHRRLTLLVN